MFSCHFKNAASVGMTVTLFLRAAISSRARHVSVQFDTENDRELPEK